MDAEDAALAQLENKLGHVNEAFELGSMHAFGVHQQVLLESFARIAEEQAALAAKHVEYGKKRVFAATAAPSTNSNAINNEQ